MKTMRIITAFSIIALLGMQQAFAFCGFYVSKADAKLFNKSSQIIIVRDGTKSVITMSNDFSGDVKDFAMVVPVPEVLKRNNIRIAKQEIFDKLDAYSGPRLVEYHDQNPCYNYDMVMAESVTRMKSVEATGAMQKKRPNKDYSVKIEASYTVGEYDILILSAKESTGLKQWLLDNDYKIPSSAEEVLEPYIKSDMKFFVVKVNLDKHQESGFNSLRPIQIAFNSDKFMLPIRLGMANAEGNQDLVVYAFTKNGRVETTNYRTAKLPTDKNIPEFVDQKFGDFYVDLFKTAWKKEGGKAVFLEYAWNLNSNNYVKCDPCATTPPAYAELREAGVYWVGQNKNGNRWAGADYTGDLFFTRLHVRYNRKNYPQDLVFQATPNKENFQGRYVIQRSVKGNLDCEAAQGYYKGLVSRRKQELKELAALTGWNTSQYNNYVYEISKKIKKEKNQWINEEDFDKGGTNGTVVTPDDKGGPSAKPAPPFVPEKEDAPVQFPDPTPAIEPEGNNIPVVDVQPQDSPLLSLKFLGLLLLVSLTILGSVLLLGRAQPAKT